MNNIEMMRRLEAHEDPLELSIQKWQDIVDHCGMNYGIDNCALCTRYFAEHCRNCPVRLRTSRIHCLGSPFEAYTAIATSFFAKFISDRQKVLDCLARTELEFLKSLRKKKVKA